VSAAAGRMFEDPEPLRLLQPGTLGVWNNNQVGQFISFGLYIIYNSLYMRRIEHLFAIGNEGTRGRQIISLLLLMVFLPSQAFANWFGGPYVEPGFAGYCLHKPTIGRILGYKGGYTKVLKGEKYGVTMRDVKPLALAMGI
jgi:hypothetical protein